MRPGLWAKLSLIYNLIKEVFIGQINCYRCTHE